MAAKDSQPPAARRRRTGRIVKVILGTAALLSAALVVRSFWRPEGASAQPLAPKAPPPNNAPQEPGKLQIVAVVNAEEITRDQLGKHCLWHYGREVLEAMVNKRIIENECKKQNVTITIKDVDAEIERMAERFGIPTAQWLKLLETERKIKPAQYAKDIVWPMLALKQLAANRLVVTEQDLIEAWETQYGEAIQARLIAAATRDEAERIRQLALAKPDEFGNLAKQYSIDKGSASVKGLIQPIRKHLGQPEIERAAFALAPGQISEVIQVADQFVILQCERRFEPRPVPLEGQIRELLTQAIRDKKLRLAADDIMRDLQARTTVDVVYNDEQRRAQNPNLAAVVGGQPITIAELAEECIERHGEQVLELLISRKLVEQVSAKQNLQISPQEIEAEIAQTAFDMGYITPDNKPDVQGWLKKVAEEGITRDMYVHDTIWPMLALKKIVGPHVEVNDTDLKRGFEANYGPRVRCRAIVLSSMRRAQEVWEMASKNPTVEHFAELAEKYSVEASTRALRGEIPPIQKWGGEPILEQEAFGLKPGELSGVIQLGENFVILLCEGYTEPKQVSFAEVRELIYEDIFAKKQRLAMAREFDRIKDASQIENYLAGTAHQPLARKNRELQSLDAEIERAAASIPFKPGQKPAPEGPRAGSILSSGAPASVPRGPTSVAPAANVPPNAPPQPQPSPSGPARIPTRLNLPPRS